METDLQDAPKRIDAEVGVPLSQRIRQRLRRDGVRFHANDNIADYLREGEIEGLQAEVAERLQRVLRSLVIDVDATTTQRKQASGWQRCSCARSSRAAMNRHQPLRSFQTSSISTS
jgi:hypothetical protein